MKEYKNKNDLLQEIDWADGLYSLIYDRGVTHVEDYDVNDTIKEKWEEAADIIDELEDIFSIIWAELNHGTDDE